MDNKVIAHFYKIDKSLLVFTCMSVNTYIMFKYYKYLHQYIKPINLKYANQIENFTCGWCIGGIIFYNSFIWNNYYK